MNNPVGALVIVGRDEDITALVASERPEQTISLLRKENEKLLHDLESERSLFREMADCLIEHKLRPNNPLNYVAISKVLEAYKKQNAFWRSRAQEMHGVNYPQQVSIESDVGIKILAGSDAEKKLRIK